MNERAVLALLLVGCAVFGLTIFAELGKFAAAPEDPTGIEQPLRRPAPTAAIAASRAPQLAQLVATTLARPLFSPTRRPPQQQDGSGNTGIADMRLTGIVTEPGERLAIFAVTGAKPLVVQEGEEVSGWRIEGIAPDAVSLSGPGGTTTLRPKPDASLVRTTPPVPAVPAPAARFAGPAGLMRARPPFFRSPVSPGFAPPARPIAAGSSE
jgi:hypothetical protein